MKRIVIPKEIADAVVAHARRELPNECCGLLAGVGDTVTASLPLVNVLQSPVRFRSEARSLFDAMKRLRQSKQDVLAIYHSHPTSAAVPSRFDIADHTWHGTAMVIVSLMDAEPVVNAWLIANDQVEPVVIES